MKAILALSIVVTLGACANKAAIPPTLGQQVFDACLEENNYQTWSGSLQAGRIHLHCKQLASSYAQGFSQSLAQVD